MRFKNYIAILIVSVFLGKFLLVDANVLNTFFHQSNISFVNQYCKNNNKLKGSETETSYDSNDLSDIQTIAFASFCTSQFSFQLFSWKINSIEVITVFNEHFTSKLSFLYLENVSPPPRFA